MFTQYNQLNQNGEVRNAIQKALTSAVGSGEALIPQSLEKVITDTIIKLSPQLALMTPVGIAGKIHEFNQLTRRPAPGGAMGESATTPVSSSVTTRREHSLKIIRRKAKITNFLNDASREYIDSASYELENHIQAQILDLVFYNTYGNEGANAYEYNGLESLIPASNRFNNVGTVTDLKLLDDMIDKNTRNGGAPHQKVFYMSPEMLSAFSRLLTNTRNNQSDGRGFYQMLIPGGWRLWAYRDIPIVETTFNTPIGAMLNTNITLSTQVTGGSLSDATYYVQVSAITYEGEQAGSVEKSLVVAGGGSAQTLEIALTTPNVDENGNPNAISYKIYVSTSTGTEVLVKQVSAFLFDAEGTIIGDNGVDANIVVTTLTPDASVPAQNVGSEPLTIVNGIAEEVIQLHDLNPIQGLGKMPFTNRGGSSVKGLITMNDLATTDDFINFLTKSYTALTPSFTLSSCWARGVKKA